MGAKAIVSDFGGMYFGKEIVVVNRCQCHNVSGIYLCCVKERKDGGNVLI